MRESSCDVLIVGGSLGGCAAAMAAASLGFRVVLTEETDWIGGQLTSQAVPPDEHPWIEEFGCTRRYRQFRDGVRRFYRANRHLGPAVAADPLFNPGGGWVSKLCHEPRVALAVLQDMLSHENIEVWLESEAIAATVTHDRIEQVVFRNPGGDDMAVSCRIALDATELGSLLHLSGTEYVTGAESRVDTGEPNAIDGPADPNNQQAITWVFAMGHDEGSNRVIDKPRHYEFWKEFRPSFWPHELFSLGDVNPHTGEPRQMPLFAADWRCWFKYRQIVDPDRVQDDLHPVTIVNWPQNDYFLEPSIPSLGHLRVAGGEAAFEAAKQQSLCWLYWLQTEAGYPGLYLRPDITGTPDGFAKTPYIRESRRILAQHTILEQHIASYTNPGLDRAPQKKDSVGVGAYRIDLHPSTGGDSYIDTSTLPFQIPLGSLIPIRMRNLLPACKNIGTTHITNGCYRLHPVEWNIGEAAGALAAFCISRDLEPVQVFAVENHRFDFQRLLREQGFELEWPSDCELHSL